MPRPPRSPWRAGLAVVGGLLVVLAPPPWGVWPLGFAGVAVLEVALGAEPSRRQRFTRGLLFGLAWLVPGMVWMWFLSAPGYIVAAIVYAGYHGLAALAAPRGPWRTIGRPAAHVLAEALRFCFPFGGVPLASLAIGQASGPFLPIVRIGGALGLTWFVLQVGFALGALAEAAPRRRAPAAAVAVGLAAAIVLVPLAAVAPDGSGGPGTTRRVTLVQGGGPQGTHAAIDADGALGVPAPPRRDARRSRPARRTSSSGRRTSSTCTASSAASSSPPLRHRPGGSAPRSPSGSPRTTGRSTSSTPRWSSPRTAP